MNKTIDLDLIPKWINSTDKIKFACPFCSNGELVASFKDFEAACPPDELNELGMYCSNADCGTLDEFGDSSVFLPVETKIQLVITYKKGDVKNEMARR